MSGLDPGFQVTLTYEGRTIYEGPAGWDWDDDDETQLRISFYVPLPEEMK